MRPLRILVSLFALLTTFVMFMLAVENYFGARLPLDWRFIAWAFGVSTIGCMWLLVEALCSRPTPKHVPPTFALGQAWVTRVSGEDGPDMYDATPSIPSHT